MSEFLKRTEALIGKAATEKLKNTHVAVFGIGGVGGYIVEALARSGIGELTQKLYDELTGIQWGKRDDPYGWRVLVK